MKGFTIVSLSCASLVSCGITQAPLMQFSELFQRKELSAPMAWTAQPQARAGIDVAWVSRFQEPRLQALIEEAFAKSHDLVMAGEKVRQAHLLAGRVQASAIPQLGVSLDGSRRKQVFTGLPIPGTSSPLSSLSNNFGAALNVSWEPDVWGKVKASKSAELARAQAEEQLLRQARASLAAQIAKTWFSLAEARGQVQLAERSLALQQETAEAVADRYTQALTDEGGTAAQIRLTRSNVASAREVIMRWRGVEQQVSRQLELLVGRYPKGELLADRMPTLSSVPPVGLPSELLLRRPDIIEAERLFASKIQDRKVAQLARFPSLSLSTSGGRASSQLADLLQSDFGVWSLAGNLAAPILSGGRLKADVEMAKSKERAALAQLQKTVLHAFGEVEQALVAERTLAQREEALEEAVKESKAALEAAQSDYQEGLESILVYLQAQSQFIQFNSQLLTLRGLRLENRIDLHLALGGDYQVRKPK